MEMITQGEAERVAAEFMGAPADDAEYGWTMQEFHAGWLVTDKWDEGAPMAGAGSYVVERASGRMLHFPSYIVRPDPRRLRRGRRRGSPLAGPLR